MKSRKLSIDAALQIGKPAGEVYEAIVDPSKMKNYFISESSGRMEEGKTLKWRFPEFDMDVPVRIGRLEKDKYISYHWENSGTDLLVEMRLEQLNGTTVVRITEGTMQDDEAGIKWLKGNTEGWANFLACLKAYLEYHINLRKGGFDFRGNK